MKDSTANLMHRRDELQKRLILQREKIAQQLILNAESNEEKFPRSNTMRFLYGTKGLMLAQLIFNQLARKHPQVLVVIKTLGQFILRGKTN